MALSRYCFSTSITSFGRRPPSLLHVGDARSSILIEMPGAVA
jgi:hypothetical protein